ncbi:MAG TPA: MFS transporter [Rhodoplanes sp.]|nr:MFS transporter [Rhodoplanes sp.]
MPFSRPIRDDGFALRMAVLYAAIFASAGSQLPFLPVWLEAKGLDAREIGLVLAAAMLARPVIVPAAMRLIDRYGWAKGPLVAAAWAACATFVAVALSDGFAAIIVAFAISALPQALVLPLADAYALRGLAARGRAYGPVRMWGSGAFIAANLGGGLVLERLGAAQVIWVLVAALAATALSATALVPLATRSHASVAPRSGAPSLWRSPAFVAVVAAASLIQASHAVLYGFASLGWAGKGLDGPAIGALWAIGVLAEIGLFAASGRIMVRVRPLDLIGVGALGAVLRWTVMAFDPPALLLPWLQCLHGLSFGATHLGAMHFLAHFAAERQGATAQGDYSTLVAVVSAAEMGLAGVLVETFGAYAYLAMAASAAGGAAIVAGARRLGLA